ncbi:MAG: hypothetical protein HC941_17040 [Microcoleus sp. SU_5_3]|nr:hypothetical protein [Microcoleus sp. SU_5_3]
MPGNYRGKGLAMASAEKKYNESRMRRSDRIKQAFALVSIESFRIRSTAIL